MNVKDMKILVCDDSIVSRRKLKDYILTLGCTEVLEAANGQEAIELYNTSKPDLVFMDIVMPKMDGIESVKEIVESYPEAKVVMASSVGTMASLRDAIKAGAYDFLQKPLDTEQVKKIIISLAEGVK